MREHMLKVNASSVVLNGKLVNVGSLEFVQLITVETINSSVGHNSDVDTFAAQYFAIHDSVSC
jgi:hypothetical protein